MIEKQCELCAAPFQSQKKYRKFCSEACKRKAYLYRNGFRYAAALTVTDRRTEQKNVCSGLLEEINKCMQLLPDADMEGWNRQQEQAVFWVNTRLKCLLNQLLRLCYLPNVTAITYEELQEAFTALTSNIHFGSLPANYSYREYIEGLKINIARFVSLTKQQGGFKLVIPTKQKALLIAVMTEIGVNVPLRKFYDLEFN